MAAALTHRRTKGGLYVGLPDYELAAPLPASSPALGFHVPALQGVTCITAALRVSGQPLNPKALSTLLCLFGNTGLTNLVYANGYQGLLGVFQNTYNQGFGGGPNATPLDNGATATFVAQFYAGRQDQQFTLFVNGHQVTLNGIGAQYTPDFNGTGNIGDTQNNLRSDCLIEKVLLFGRELSPAACRSLLHP